MLKRLRVFFPFVWKYTVFSFQKKLAVFYHCMHFFSMSHQLQFEVNCNWGITVLIVWKLNFPLQKCLPNRVLETAQKEICYKSQLSNLIQSSLCLHKFPLSNILTYWNSITLSREFRLESFDSFHCEIIKSIAMLLCQVSSRHYDFP